VKVPIVGLIHFEFDQGGIGSFKLYHLCLSEEFRKQHNYSLQKMAPLKLVANI